MKNVEAGSSRRVSAELKKREWFERIQSYANFPDKFWIFGGA